jgi:hypothetical protein
MKTQTPTTSGSRFTKAELSERTTYRRAVEAVIWGMPVVNFDLMLQEMLSKTSARMNQVVYWGRPLDWHNQTLTPNPDTLYFMAFFDTKGGPMVLDLPPADEGGSFNGNIVTTWQMPLEDAGLLGRDRGKGGRFVILPPGYTGPEPANAIVLRSDVFGGFLLFRSNLESHGDADVARSVAYAKRLRVYPLAEAANPPATIFVDAQDVLFDSTIRYDARLFEGLDRIVQREPWLERDRAMIGTLKSIGIEKGKPFRPDDATKALLASAAREAGDWLDTMWDAGPPPFFSPTSHWTLPAMPDAIQAQQNGFSDLNAYPIDSRGFGYSYAYVGIKNLGAGQMYLIAVRDEDGDALDGAKSYRLRVPPNAPVEQYWSVTAYDHRNHALIQGMPRASRSSQIPELQKNADGSIDIFVGPEAPAGHDANWLPTDPGGAFELMFRLYAPTKALFEKQWILPDVVKAS